jgi:hypothetical protein
MRYKGTVMAYFDLRRDDRHGVSHDILEKFRETARRHRIRCPSCGWQPAPSSRWFCVAAGPPEHFSPGCGTSWNTFDTRGRCPGCDHQWRWTACLACGAWAPHDDWYEPEA